MSPLGEQYAPQMDWSVLKDVSVLVVEDAWHVAKAVTSVLEQAEMRVIGPTATIAEARRLIALRMPRIALVDVNLRQEMACALVDELHSLGVHVIVMSGYAVPPVAMEKAAAFVQKPFSAKQIMTAMCAIVSEPD